MTGTEREELVEHFMDALDEAEKQHAPVVPDEAVRVAARAIAEANNHECFDEERRISDPEWWAEDQEDRDYYRGHASAALREAAPFIVAANQPDAAEVDDALLRELRQRVLIGTPVERERALTRYVAAQVAAARAGESHAEVERLRAQRDVVLGIHRDDGWGFCSVCITNMPVTGSRAPWPCATARALGVTEAL